MRFELTYFDCDYVTDHLNNIDYPVIDKESMFKVVGLLNELHEDNQLLHKMNAEAIDFMYDNFDLSILFTDRALNNICNEMGWELSEKGIKITQLEKENEQLKEALKNKYWNEICENCKYGKYERNWYGEGEFECLKKHFGNDDWKCDGLKECDDFELDLKRFLDD